MLLHPKNMSSSPSPCFTTIQSRKFWSPPCSNVCQLCPSMDLIVLGLEPTGSTMTTTATSTSRTSSCHALWIYRILSWQKLATLSFHPTDENILSCHCACWSPDGRQLAVAVTTAGSTSSSNDNNVSSSTLPILQSDSITGSNTATGSRVVIALYPIEALSNTNSNASNGGGGGEGTLSSTMTPHHTFQLQDTESSCVQSLHWSHVGRPHPKAWKLSQDQSEEEISWK